MNDDDEVVLESVMRGRLIFPHRAELMAMRDEAAMGPLTAAEKERKAELERAYSAVEQLDKAYHAAFEKEDYAECNRLAEQVLALSRALDGDAA